MTGALTTDLCLVWAARLVSVSIIISCLEYLTVRRVLSAPGLIDWELEKMRVRGSLVGPAAGLLQWLFRYPNVLFLVGSRLVLAGAMILVPVSWMVVVPAFALAVLFCVRSPYGQDGADNMANIVLGALVIATLVPQPGVKLAAVAFMGLQCALSYTIAGAAKLTEPQWRNGEHLCGILGTESYGLRPVALILHRTPVAAGALSRGILFWETTFILGMLAPHSVALVYLGLGVAFHLANAVFMGLNTFVWSFLATYPALVFWLQVRPW